MNGNYVLPNSTIIKSPVYNLRCTPSPAPTVRVAINPQPGRQKTNDKAAPTLSNVETRCVNRLSNRRPTRSNRNVKAQARPSLVFSISVFSTSTMGENFKNRSRRALSRILPGRIRMFRTVFGETLFRSNRASKSQPFQLPYRWLTRGVRSSHGFSLSRRFGVFIDINASQSPSLQS